jgi:hypothetical protein
MSNSCPDVSVYSEKVSFNVIFSCILFQFQRWQKAALLVFSALAFVSAKTKCAACAVGFSCMPHNGPASMRRD